MLAENHVGGSGNPFNRIAIAIAGFRADRAPRQALLVGRHPSAPAFLGLKLAAFQDVVKAIYLKATKSKMFWRCSHYVPLSRRSAPRTQSRDFALRSRAWRGP